MSRLEEIIADFNAFDDDDLRLQMLLDYANRLPALPPDLAARRDAGDNRVPECMTPVHLWILPEGEAARIHADVAEEAPTVKGILSIIVGAYDRAPASELAALPTDLVNRLGLSRAVRMNRAVGLNAIIQRIRREAGALTAGQGAAS